MILVVRWHSLKNKIPCQGNAHQKASYVKVHFGVDCFADDTGLEVDALNGAPGVHSARYAGPDGDDIANYTKLLQELEHKGNSNSEIPYRYLFAKSPGSTLF